MQPQSPFGGQDPQPQQAQPGVPPMPPQPPYGYAPQPVPAPQMQPQVPATPPIPQQVPLPTYPTGTAHTANPSDYEFIVNPTRPAKKLPLLGGGSGKLVLIAGGLLGLLLVVVLISSFTKRGPDYVDTFLSIGQKQTELIAMTDYAIKKQEASRQTQTIAFTTNMTITTDKGALTGYMSSTGAKIKPEMYAMNQDPTLGRTFDSAMSAGTFDTVFQKTMETKLTAYQQALKAAYTTTSGAKGKAILSSDYDNSVLLLQQVKQN